jgi:SAM-dependent methyltransferase
MSENNLASQDHWDGAYKDLIFFKPSFSDPIARFIKKYSYKKQENYSVFEIGCFPGRYLSVFGDQGLVLNGVDLTPRVAVDMPKWLKSQDYRLGGFYCDDFFKFKTNNTYNIVCSFGFIEHFTNYEEVIKQHLSLVAPGGLIILSAPNFKGCLQKFLHSYLDKENLERHHLLAMDPLSWEKVLREAGYEIVFCGFVGGFDFWGEDKSNNVFKKILVKLINLSGKILRFLPFNHRSFSPYAAVVAKNKNI